MLSRVFMQRSQSDLFDLSRSDGPFGETTLADHEATICFHHTVAQGKPLLSQNVFQHPRGITKSATEPTIDMASESDPKSGKSHLQDGNWRWSVWKFCATPDILLLGVLH
jgi:hypothetical protein